MRTTLFTASLICLAAWSWALPVTLEFDTYPGGNWANVNGGGSSFVSEGILTIDAPSTYHEFILWHPNDDWHQFVDNSRGWSIEARLRVDPITDPFCDQRRPVQIWANDHTNLVVIGFSRTAICIAYPDIVTYPMDTTSDFHTYTIDSIGSNVRVSVDGTTVIDHELSWTGGGSDILNFGDGHGGYTSKSYWDYFSYDTGEECVPEPEIPYNGIDEDCDGLDDDIIEGAVDEIRAIVDAIPTGDWKNGNNASTFHNKLDAIVQTLNEAVAETDPTVRYVLLMDALDRIENDLIKKTEGCGNSGAPEGNDWVQSCASQAPLYNALLDLVGFVAALL